LKVVHSALPTFLSSPLFPSCTAIVLSPKWITRGEPFFLPLRHWSLFFHTVPRPPTQVCHIANLFPPRLCTPLQTHLDFLFFSPFFGWVNFPPLPFELSGSFYGICQVSPVGARCISAFHTLVPFFFCEFLPPRSFPPERFGPALAHLTVLSLLQ